MDTQQFITDMTMIVCRSYFSSIEEICTNFDPLIEKCKGMLAFFDAAPDDEWQELIDVSRNTSAMLNAFDSKFRWFIDDMKYHLDDTDDMQIFKDLIAIKVKAKLKGLESAKENAINDFNNCVQFFNAMKVI